MRQAASPLLLMPLNLAALAAGRRLVISEPIAVCREGLPHAGAPGLFTSEQANGWRLFTAAAQARGELIVAQLTHAAPVSAQGLDLVLQRLIEAFRDAAEHAGDAGFDGVELRAGDDGGDEALIDLLQTLAGVWPAARVGLSLRPRPGGLQALLPALRQMGLAYLRLLPAAGSEAGPLSFDLAPGDQA